MDYNPFTTRDKEQKQASSVQEVNTQHTEKKVEEPVLQSAQIPEQRAYQPTQYADFYSQPYQTDWQPPFQPYGMPQNHIHQPRSSNGFAIGSLILGSISFVLAVSFYVVLFLAFNVDFGTFNSPFTLSGILIACICTGIVGTILGGIGMKDRSGRVMAILGMVISIIGFLSVLSIFLLFILISAL